MAIQDQTQPMDLQLDSVRAICQQYGVAKLALFGSIVRTDFTDESDVDVLCQLQPDSPARGLRWIELALALGDLWGRPVDLVKPHLLDTVIRNSVLKEAQTVYVAP